MKNIKSIISLGVITLLLSACGGGGSASSTKETNEPQARKISVEFCDETRYTDIQEGDILIKEEDSTVVDIVHNSDDSKKVCVVSGAAYLSRQ